MVIEYIEISALWSAARCAHICTEYSEIFYCGERKNFSSYLLSSHKMCRVAERLVCW